MDLRGIGATLPPGFRFYPSDEELVCHYLYKKIANEEVLKGTLVEIDLHTCEPWQLPEVAKLNSNEWYFFSFRDRKYATGYRTNRATTSGYWKATGKDRIVHDPMTHAIVGMRKTLVFHRNRAPNGMKTGWIMHEFRLENPHMPPKEDWVLCRVFHKSKASEENSGTLSPQTIVGVTSPNLASSSPTVHQTMQQLPCGYHHHQITSFSQSQPHNQSHNPSNSTVLNLATLNPSFLHLAHGTSNNVHVNEMFNSKCDDEYELLFDMGFGETSCLGDGVPPSLEEMRFDDDKSILLF